jgi:hypothetical protein
MRKELIELLAAMMQNNIGNPHTQRQKADNILV